MEELEKKLEEINAYLKYFHNAHRPLLAIKEALVNRKHGG